MNDFSTKRRVIKPHRKNVRRITRQVRPTANVGLKRVFFDPDSSDSEFAESDDDDVQDQRKAPRIASDVSLVQILK